MKKIIIFLMLMVIIKEDDNFMSVEPLRNDLILKISGILSGHEDRKSVSKWAVSIFDDDSLRVSDSIILNYLKLLGAVDLPSSDRDFLYTNEDLKEWLSELNNQ
ncbi:hypothetical protein [Edaphovirga cremea]|uniref:hypothetical protein n=1 Tax=Edaphovirga cremea TaxID=2267246 RepID=UPI003988AAE4